MKSKMIAVMFAGMFLAGGSLFAQSRFSFSIGSYAPGYYAHPPAYYDPGPPHVLYRGYRGPDRAWGGAGYWGEDPDREHRQAEWYGLHNHQQNEQFENGDSEALREHQAQERWELRHEQWHERNGDFDAAHGPAHGSARDGYRFGY